MASKLPSHDKKFSQVRTIVTTIHTAVSNAELRES